MATIPVCQQVPESKRRAFGRSSKLNIIRWQFGFQRWSLGILWCPQTLPQTQTSLDIMPCVFWLQRRPYKWAWGAHPITIAVVKEQFEVCSAGSDSIRSSSCRQGHTQRPQTIVLPGCLCRAKRVTMYQVCLQPHIHSRHPEWFLLAPDWTQPWLFFPLSSHYQPIRSSAWVKTYLPSWA